MVCLRTLQPIEYILIIALFFLERLAVIGFNELILIYKILIIFRVQNKWCCLKLGQTCASNKFGDENALELLSKRVR